VQILKRRSLLVIMDIILVNLAALVSLWLGAQRSNWPFSPQFVGENFYWFLLPSVGYFILATVNDCYELNVASNSAAIAWALVRVTVQILLAYVVVYFFLPPVSLPRHVIGFFSLILPVTLLIWRWLYIVIFSHPSLRRRVIVVGAGWAGQTITQAIRENLRDYEIVGFVDDDPEKQGETFENIPVLASTAQLYALCQRMDVSELIVAISRHMTGEMFQNILDCHEHGLQITPMSLLYEQMLGCVPVEHVGDNWFLVLPISNFDSFNLTMFVKRTIDIAVSLVGLGLLAILFPFIALAIRLDSPGSLFYRQTRVGKAGKHFQLLKLRSMIPQAEQEGKPKWAAPDDKRVTRVGRFLRKTRLDEMPQFYNVLKGEMSLIGPRPERPEFVTQLEKAIPFYRARLVVRPGLTGWAQTRFTYSSSVEDSLVKLQYDLYYIKHLSLYLDLLIFLRTFGVILSLKGR